MTDASSPLSSAARPGAVSGPDVAPDAAAVRIARDVLRQEAAALAALSEALPPDFAAAVATILAAPGRVIVAGLGKSGHVARKIAATLASTGTPADFLHAAEAAHGDLGMIVPGDVALLISKSGETAELAPIIYHVTRFGIPLIAISCAPNGTLMRAAAHRLVLPDLPEACPIGVAPTTSTTMTLALGDALAMALLEARGFSAENFGALHPGGTLGAQLRPVQELAQAEVPLVGPGTRMDEVIRVISRHGFGIAGVVDGQGRLAGVVTDGDLRRAMAPDLLTRAVETVMSHQPRTAAPATLASTALARMEEERISALFLVDEAGRPTGLLRLLDLLRGGVA